MPQVVTTVNHDVNDIASSGGTLSISTRDMAPQYLIYGTLTPSSNLTINADTSSLAPVNGMTYIFEYAANVTLIGSNTLTIFGLSLTPAQALTYGKIVSTWDSINSVWHTQYFPDFTRSTNFIEASQLSTSTCYETINTIVSFEAGETTSFAIFLPYKCVIINTMISIIKTIAETDNAILVLKDYQNSNKTIDSYTIPMNTGSGTGINHNAINYSFVPQTGNTSYFLVEPSKVTPGGKLILALVVQKI